MYTLSPGWLQMHWNITMKNRKCFALFCFTLLAFKNQNHNGEEYWDINSISRWKDKFVELQRRI